MSTDRRMRELERMMAQGDVHAAFELGRLTEKLESGRALETVWIVDTRHRYGDSMNAFSTYEEALFSAWNDLDAGLWARYMDDEPLPSHENEPEFTGALDAFNDVAEDSGVAVRVYSLDVDIEARQ